MSNLTTPLYKILRSNTHDYDLNTLAGLYNASMETVFNSAPLSTLDENIRQRFVTGFSLHYFAREIGQETIPLWKISLAEKIYNNAEYINEIFADLDKQVFANYKVHRGSRADNNVESHVDINDRLHNDSNAKKLTDDDSATELNTSQGSNANAHNEAVVNTGVNNDAMSDQTADDSTNASTNVADNNATDNNNGSSSSANYNDSRANSVSGAIDAPQGTLSAIRNPNVDVSGMGVSAVRNAQYNYLSSGALSDGTTIADGVNSETNENVNAHHDDSNSANSSVSHNEGSHSSDRDASHSDLSQRDASGNSNDVASSFKQNDNQRNSDEVNTSTGEENSNNTGSKTNNGQSEDEYVDYDLSNEVLLQTIPFMSKIWEIFDSCFSLII